MANVTTNSPGYYVDVVAESFFNWFQNDILPVCTAMFDILAIIVGLGLNILLLVTFRKRGLYNDPSTYFVTMLIVADFVSYVFLLLPNIISAFASNWILSQPVCEIHGSFLFLLVFVNFGFAGILGVERAIKLCRQQHSLYDRIFETKKYRVFIMISVWILATIIAFIPTMGAGDVRYDFYHQGCMLDYQQTPSFLVVHFMLTIVSSFVIVIVCYSLIFNSRRQYLIKDRLRRIQATKRGRNEKRLLSTDNELPTISETDGDVKDNNLAFERVPIEKQTKRSVNMNGRHKRPKSREPLIFEVFSDDVNNPGFHLSITYIALWGTITVCCLPYFVVCFYGTFNDGPLWGGFYTITLLLTHTCFVAKPFVYLGHNRHYRHVAKQTVPHKVRNGASSMRSSVHSMSETVQDLIFRSNAQAKFRKALATQKVVAIWKRKSTKNKGMIKLKEEPESVNVKSVSFDVKSDSVNTTSPGGKGVTQVTAVSSEPRTINDRASVTPSGVIVTTAPSPTHAQSSYMESERRKLLGFNKQDHSNLASRDRCLQAGENNVSPVPGMVDSDLAIV